MIFSLLIFLLSENSGSLDKNKKISYTKKQQYETTLKLIYQIRSRRQTANLAAFLCLLFKENASVLK